MQKEREDGNNFGAVANLVVKVRERMKLNQEDMAAKLDIACVRYYQDLEYGEKQPSLQLFLRIAALADDAIMRDFHQRLEWAVPVCSVIFTTPLLLAVA